jgi:hypothetical protein
MDLNTVWVVDLFDSVQDRNSWRDLMKAVMNLRFP